MPEGAKPGERIFIEGLEVCLGSYAGPIAVAISHALIILFLTRRDGRERGGGAKPGERIFIEGLEVPLDRAYT